jgi:LCP family protein required for cell wall assembly
VTFPDFSTPGAGLDHSAGPAHARVLAGHSSGTRVVAMVMTGVLAFAISGAFAALTRWTGNIDTAPLDTLTNRPEKVVPTDPSAGEPVNLLLMGSDSRAGANVNIGGTGGNDGERSDTTILLHISGDRSRVEAISIPRDSTVDIPSCVTTNGKTTAPQRGKFNAAFAAGASVGEDTASGALCTMQTVESLTGVFLDGFMVMDFQGFQRMIDAVGGVELCIEEAINAPKANNLQLEPGLQTLQGNIALDYARARTGAGLGDGSDLGRIGRQQQLLASLVRTVLSADTLTNPAKTLSFVDAVTSSMTMDERTAQLDRLTGLAYSLRDLRPDTVTFVTVPNGQDPYNNANVVWTEAATMLWDNIRHDRPIDHDPTATAAPSPTDGTSAASGASASPSAPDDETIDPTASPSTDDVKEAGREAFTGADTTAVCG